MKILIFGIPGSGKTHLAKKLSKILKLPIFHVDRHFFQKGWVERDHDHFLEDVREVLKKEDWIIDGNGMRTLEMRYKEADIAIYCKLPRLFCFYRILYRYFSTLGKDKEDGPDGSKNSITLNLVRYLWRFPIKYKEPIQKLQEKYPKVEFIEICSKKKMRTILDTIQKF